MEVKQLKNKTKYSENPTTRGNINNYVEANRYLEAKLPFDSTLASYKLESYLKNNRFPRGYVSIKEHDVKAALKMDYRTLYSAIGVLVNNHLLFWSFETGNLWVNLIKYDQ